MPRDGKTPGSPASDRVLSRRALLAMFGAGSVTALAGCGGDSGSTPTPTTEEGPPGFDDTPTPTGDGTMTPTPTRGPLDDVSGQPLVLPMTNTIPEESIFVETIRNPSMNPYSRAFEVIDAMYEPGVIGRWRNDAYDPNPGRSFPRLYESVEWDIEMGRDENSVTVSIREGADWSDGTPVTAKDAAAWYAFLRLNISEDGNWFQDNHPPWRKFNRIEMPDGPDGKVFTLHDTNGQFDNFPDIDWAKGQLSRQLLHRFQAAPMATHKEPFGSLADAALANLESAPDEYTRTDPLMEEHFSESDFDKFRDPDFVVSHGAWMLSEVRGTTEVVLEPNPEYWNADAINYDQLTFRFMPGEERYTAELSSGRLDAGDISLSQGVADSLPDKYEVKRTAGGQGDGIALDHSDPHFGRRNVRAAMMYALDKQRIARNDSPETGSPIAVPGGDVWARDAVLSNEFVEENFINYGEGSNTDMADQLMQDAGYEREDGVWVGPDGNEMSYSLATNSGTPAWEQTAAEILSNWGVETQVQPLEGSVFQNQFLNGQLTMWTNPVGTGFYSGARTAWHFPFGANKPRAQAFNIYGEEDQQEAFEAYRDTGWWTGYEDGKPLKIEIPPVGEPDGELQEFAPAWFNIAATIDDDVPFEPLDYWGRLLWAWNWFLPTLPLFQTSSRSWLNTENWIWPQDHYMWDYFPISTSVEQFASTGWIQADPDNPKDGATVE